MRNVRIDNEAGAQETLFNWAQYQYARYPELELLYHIPNGGKRDARTAANLKRQGVKAGVPDLHLPVARGGYNGLYIELKVGSNKPTQLQKKWLSSLNEQGYLAVVCYGWQEAAEQLINYLELETAAGGLKSADNETEKEALQVLTGTRDDYNDYARALNIAIRVLREHVAEIDKKSQNQRREREADYESNKHY